VEASWHEGSEEVQRHEHLRTRIRLRTSHRQADTEFHRVDGPVVRDVASEPGSESGSAGSGAATGGSRAAAVFAADSGTAAAIGGADRAVSGFAGGADPGGGDVSRSSGGSGQMAASKSEFDRRRAGASREPAALGSEREGAYGVSFGSGEYGQESIVDLIAGRRLLQPAERCDERDSGDAAEGAAGGHAAVDAATNHNDARLDDRHSAGQSDGGLRARVRSVGGLRIPNLAVALLVSVPRNLVRRTVSLVRHWIRHWVLWGLRVGMVSLGI